MKKLILITLLFVGCSAYSQTSELLVYPGKETKKACFKGGYKTIENYLSNKCKQDKQTFDRYVLFTSKDLVFELIFTEKDPMDYTTMKELFVCCQWQEGKDVLVLIYD